VQRAANEGETSYSAILPIRGHGLVFERGERRLLDGIDIEIAGTGTLVIVGPNGAGKSLLVRVLAGLIEPTAGAVTWAGRAPERRWAPKIGFVFQRPVLLRRSAQANIEYALAGGSGRKRRWSARGSRTSPIPRRACFPAASSNCCRSPARSPRGRRS
jgi:tungstate transport system ATP-binding protein